MTQGTKLSSTPLVTVCMVTYQHERYVAAAVRSVLEQTHQDLELVIVNDGSSDGTAEVVGQFHDPRIRYLEQGNQGPAVATNIAIRAARGRYVALFSGDDVCHPDRIGQQLAACRRGPHRLIFSDVDFIDDDGNAMTGEHFAANWFDGKAATRAQVLARLFHRGNFLNGVTTFGERDLFLSEPYDPALLQLQDFDLWVRLIKSCDIEVLPLQLVSYRIRNAGGNLSAPSPDVTVRCANEHYLILRRFFDGVPMPLFREAFAESLIFPDFTGDLEFQCELAFLYTRSSMPMARVIGMEKLQRLLNDPAGAKKLEVKYRYHAVDFFELMRSQDVFNLFGNYQSTVFYDTGSGFVAGQEVRTAMRVAPGPFVMQFDLPLLDNMCAVRWDPLEGRTCRVRLESIHCGGASGMTAVNFDELASNGWRGADNAFDFEHTDPSIWWPVASPVTRIVVKGHWEFDQLPDTVAQLRAQVAELTKSLEEKRMTAAAATIRIARHVMARLKAG